MEKTIALSAKMEYSKRIHGSFMQFTRSLTAAEACLMQRSEGARLPTAFFIMSRVLKN